MSGSNELLLGSKKYSYDNTVNYEATLNVNKKRKHQSVWLTNDEVLIIISQPHAYVSNLSWNLTLGPHSCLLYALFILNIELFVAASNRSRLHSEWTRVTHSDVPRIISHVFSSTPRTKKSICELISTLSNKRRTSLLI